MKKQHSRTILIGIVVGVFIGCFIGVLGLLRVLPDEDFLNITYIVIRVCFGIIVLLADILCVTALLRPRFIDDIIKNGVKVTGKIVGVDMISHPSGLDKPESIRPARFAFTVSYRVGRREYRETLPPTCLTSKKGMLPLEAEEGADIPLICRKGKPERVIIDDDMLINGIKTEMRASRVHFVMLPVVVTLAYILWLIVLV